LVGRYVLLYMLLKFYSMYGKPLYGRKKIQKLLFLVEHFDLGSKRIVKSRGLTGYRFVVWSYGPFSKEIYEDLEKLVDEGYVEERVVGSDATPEYEGIVLDLYTDDGFPKRMFIYEPRVRDPSRILGQLEKKLDHRVVTVIDGVLQEFGLKMPHELEDFVNGLLKLSPDKKVRYWGIDIDSYLDREGLA